MPANPQVLIDYKGRYGGQEMTGSQFAKFFHALYRIQFKSKNLVFEYYLSEKHWTGNALTLVTSTLNLTLTLSLKNS